MYIILHLLEPIIPHIVSELSSILFDRKNLKNKIDIKDEVFEKSTMKYAITISGKKRTEISVDANLTKDEILDIAKNNSKKWLDGKEIIKTIFVPNKLINFVVK